MTAKKTSARPTPADTSTSKKATAKKTTAKKAAAKKTAAKKATAKNTAKKTAPKKAAAKKATTKKTAPNKATAKKAAAKTSTTKKTTAKKTTAKKTTAKKTTAKKTTAKKTGGTTPAKKRATPSRRSTVSLAVLPGEKPWTTGEVAAVRGELDAERQRLLSELSSAEDDMATLLRDGGEGAGSDQADIGSSALERDAEMSLANNTRDMLFQVDRAQARLDDGSYGVCESCGNPIGKARLMAFPRATLCMSCKQHQERR